jgi:26S proteasome regulatory subunit T5
MSSAPPPSNPPPNPEKLPEEPAAEPSSSEPTDAEAMDTDPPAEETWADIPEDIMALSTDEILTRIRLIENDIKVWVVYNWVWGCL